jgi:hypothetical protein
VLAGVTRCALPARTSVRPRSSGRGERGVSNRNKQQIRPYIGVLLLAVALGGCQARSDAPTAATTDNRSASARATSRGVSLGKGMGNPLNDSTERDLITRIRAMYSAVDGAAVAAELESPYVMGMRSGNSKVQELVDILFARRAAAAASASARLQQSRPNAPLVRHVAVGIVDSLSDPSASAEILRRTDIEPHDVILLRASQVTSGALQAAIHGYGELWRGEARGLPPRNLRVVVHGERHMKSWTTANEGFFGAQISDALAKPTTRMKGLRSGHYFDIVVGLPPSSNINGRAF